MPRARTLAAVLLAAAIAGCADSAPPTQVRSGRIAVTLDDFSIRPQRIRARPGRIEFQVVNHGAVGHTFHVLRGDRVVVTGKTLLPGASATEAGTFTRGDYKMLCILGNHEDLGMYGTLVVR